MCLLFFFGFTLIELIIVIAIIAIIAAIAIPNLIKATRSARCVKLQEEIKKELTAAEETAKKLYDGDATATDTQLNDKLKSVTEKLTRLKEVCGEKDYSTIAGEIDTLTAQLKLYMGGDSPPPEKSILDDFVKAFDELKKKLTK